MLSETRPDTTPTPDTTAAPRAVPLEDARPSELRTAVLEQHRELRRILGALEGLAKRATTGDRSCVSALRLVGRYAYARLLAHLEYEDAHLVPAIEEADAWGDARAALITAEHADQRRLFASILAHLEDADIATIALGRHVLSFVETLYEDMAHEEQTVLDADLLRDDVVGINVEAG